MEYVQDQGVNVEFYRDSVPSAFQSEAAGHPVFVEKDFIRIVVPGEVRDVIEVPVDETHQKRFPLQWAKYQAGSNLGEIVGWRLETWPAVNTAQVKTLKFLNVHTVEQLAGLSDSALQAVGMGAMELRTRARAAIDASKNGAAAEAQALENQRLRDEIETMKVMMAQLMEPKDAAADAAADAAPGGDQATTTQAARGKPGPKPKATTTQAAE